MFTILAYNREKDEQRSNAMESIKRLPRKAAALSTIIMLIIIMII